MHWSEIAAAFLIVIGALALLAFLGAIGLVVWSVARASLWNPPPPERTETAFGEFLKEDSFWVGAAESSACRLCITASDVNGQPNLTLLRRLPQLLIDLPVLERTARDRVSAITDKHCLSEIGDDHSADFVLGFSRDEDAWGETIYVHFNNDEVVDWSAVD